jgi:hypothetical protein
MEMALCGDAGRFWNMAGDYRAAPAGFFRKALWVDCLFAVAYPAMFISLGYLCAFHFFGRAGWPFSLIYALATVTGVLDLRENAGILRLLGKGPASSDSFQIMRLRAASVQKWVFFFLTAGASGLALLILQLYPGPSFQPSWMITGAGILMTLASLVGLTNIRNVRNTQDLMRTIRDAMRSVQMALLIIVVLYLVLGIQAFIA